MRLQQVTYRVFEHEIGPLGAGEPLWHQIDGEVVLAGKGDAEFISWCSEPVQYCVGRRRASFFNPGALRAVDLSRHTIWHRLVGREVSVRFADPEHQVLRIEGAGCTVFLSSQYDDGRFQGDCIRVSSKDPLLKPGVAA